MKKLTLVLLFSMFTTVAFTTNIYARSMCGYFPGDDIELSRDYTTLYDDDLTDPCCTVNSIDYDAGYKKYYLHVRCTNCLAIIKIYKSFSFDSCQDLREARFYERPTPTPRPTPRPTPTPTPQPLKRGTREYVYTTGDFSPIIRRRWENGYDLIDVGYGSGGWFGVFSEKSGSLRFCVVNT